MSVKLRDFELTKSEIKDLTFVILLLSILFSISISRFSNQNLDVIVLFIQFLIFFTFLFISRLFFMKFIALKQGMQLYFYQTKFSKYGIKKYNEIRDAKTHKAKKIPMSIISLFIYFLTFGVFIYSAIFRYKFEKVPHLFIGTKQKWEYKYSFMSNQDISDYRKMKVLFSGYLFYFIFALLLKAIFPSNLYYSWFTFALFYIAFISLIPVFGTEGFDLFQRNRFAYISSITMLSLVMISTLIFESMSYVILSSVFTTLIIVTIIFYNNFFKDEK